jgi:hypothetical protein
MQYDVYCIVHRGVSTAAAALYMKCVSHVVLVHSCIASNAIFVCIFIALYVWYSIKIAHRYTHVHYATQHCTIVSYTMLYAVPLYTLMILTMIMLLQTLMLMCNN